MPAPTPPPTPPAEPSLAVGGMFGAGAAGQDDAGQDDDEGDDGSRGGTARQQRESARAQRVRALPSTGGLERLASVVAGAMGAPVGALRLWPSRAGGHRSQGACGYRASSAAARPPQYANASLTVCLLGTAAGRYLPVLRSPRFARFLAGRIRDAAIVRPFGFLPGPEEMSARGWAAGVAVQGARWERSARELLLRLPESDATWAPTPVGPSPRRAARGEAQQGGVLVSAATTEASAVPRSKWLLSRGELVAAAAASATTALLLGVALVASRRRAALAVGGQNGGPVELATGSAAQVELDEEQWRQILREQVYQARS
jgi:hypothetical protein